jgi:hypothetical protein
MTQKGFKTFGILVTCLPNFSTVQARVVELRQLVNSVYVNQRHLWRCSEKKIINNIFF